MASQGNGTVPGWLARQWWDIRGHAKWAIIVAIGSAVVTAAIALTHGLALWQQMTLAALFVLLFGWAVAASVMRKMPSEATRTESPEATPVVTNLPVIEAAVDTAVALNVRLTQLERAGPDATWVFKSKFRVTLTNETAKDLDVLAPDWDAELSDVPLQRPAQNFCCLQAEGDRGWRADSWRMESARLHIRPGETFRLWIGFDQSCSDEELKRRAADGRLGTLTLPVKIGGVYREFRKRF
jgi:hypothetical protein